jgi:hypothetical protein
VAKQQSSIDLLPDDIRVKLQELLRDPRLTQLGATARINAILEEQGHPERLSKSSVNRYALSMEKVGAKLRQSREVAQMWIGELGAEPAGDVGKLLNEMVRTIAFDLTMRLAEGDIDDIDPKMIKDLATGIHRLERAASENVRLEEETRKKERERLKEAALQAVDQVTAKDGGRMTAERFKQIIRETYGA